MVRSGGCSDPFGGGRARDWLECLRQGSQRPEI